MTTLPLYIHLEGMDLAGKTTARDGLAKAIGRGCQIRHNSMSDTNSIYALADRLRRTDATGVEALGYLYVAAMAADLEQHSLPAVPTIQDSTIILRSLAYHTVVGTPFVADALMDLLPRHPRFTKSFVLTANLDVRRQRLKQRQTQQPNEVAADDLQILRAPETFIAMEATLTKLAIRHFDAVVIDTSSLSPTEVLKRIVSHIPSFHANACA